MKKITAIIIDDEKSSRDSLLKKIVSHCPEVDLIQLCENGEEGISAITSLHPGIVFLDVEMPRMNGFTMLQQLPYKDFDLIFTTAYDHYAIQAIRYSAIDYLVKPIEPADLVAAIKRITVNKGSVVNARVENLVYNLMRENQSKRLAIPSQEGLQFVDQDTILFLEAKSNYTEIYLADSPKITVSKTLKDFEDLLPSSSFIRIHHSHLINKQHVMKYIRGEGGQVLMRNGRTLDVSRRKKDEFIKAISQT